jgi:hypothetical protein
LFGDTRKCPGGTAAPAALAQPAWSRVA